MCSRDFSLAVKTATTNTLAKPCPKGYSPPARTPGKSGIRETGIGRFWICSRDFSRQGYTDLDFSNSLLDSTSVENSASGAIDWANAVSVIRRAPRLLVK